MASQATFLTIPAGDWLQAIAAFLGVAATIGATLWLEHYRRARGDKRRMLGVLAHFDGMSTEFTEHIPPEMTDPVHRGISLSAQKVLLDTIAQFQFIRSRTELTDPDKWLAMEKLNASIELNLRTLKDGYVALRDAGQNPQVYADNYQQVMTALAQIIDEVRSVKTAFA